VFHQNTKGYRDPFRIRDNHDHRENRDYRSSEILSDNRDYRFSKKSCNNRDNHIQQEAIIVFTEKLKISFCINPSGSHSTSAELLSKNKPSKYAFLN
jgi:hypothetical protein